MKIIDCEQGSGEWLSARIGLPTASQFHRLLTPKTRKFSAQARTYAHFLIAEKLLNQSLESLDYLEWVARGKELEPQAVRLYEFERNVETRPVGFITTDDGRIGATPDRLLVGKNGAVEIKCPAPQTHIGWMVDGFGEDYSSQVQGQMLVGEFDFVDRYSYHPELPPLGVRTYRDEEHIAALRDALDRFLVMYDEMFERVHSSGFFAERKALRTAVDDQAKAARDPIEYLGT